MIQNKQQLVELLKKILLEKMRQKNRLQKNKPAKNKFQKNKIYKPKKIREINEPKITDEEGAKMIQYLQKIVGIDEPYEGALASWRKFSPQEKQRTIEWYHVCKSRSN